MLQNIPRNWIKKTCGKCNKVKDESQFYANGPDRLSFECKDCSRARAKKTVAKQTPEQKAHARKLATERQRRYYEKDRERFNAIGAAWRSRNPEKVKGYSTKRRGGLKTRTPAWADLEAIKFFYECKPAGCHVDHIIPLNGKLVSGLHVVENLQWMPARANIQKGNNYTPLGG